MLMELTPGCCFISL